MAKHQTAPSNGHLHKLIDDKLVANAAELARAFGVGTSTISQWLGGKNPAPRWTLLAAEGLRRRRRATRDVYWILRLPIDKPEAHDAIRQIARSFGGIMSQAIFKED